MAMIPRDHISDFGPYSVRVTISGAIQYGVPTVVVRFACTGSVGCEEKPKSTCVGYATWIRDIITESDFVHTEFNVTSETQ
jgi:hypothetical protein